MWTRIVSIIYVFLTLIDKALAYVEKQKIKEETKKETIEKIKEEGDKLVLQIEKDTTPSSTTSSDKLRDDDGFRRD